MQTQLEAVTPEDRKSALKRTAKVHGDFMLKMNAEILKKARFLTSEDLYGLLTPESYLDIFNDLRGLEGEFQEALDVVIAKYQ